MLARELPPPRQVWDSSGSGCVRYSADGAGEAAMGHVAENDVLQAALLHQLRRPGSSTELLWPVRLFAVHEQHIKLLKDAAILLVLRCSSTAR